MAREPDEHPHAEGTGGADDFDAIVSAWRREGPVPEWPSESAVRPESLAATPESPGPPRPPATGDQDAVPDAPDEAHFVPPDPPPLPRMGPPAAVGLGLLVLGLVLAFAPGWLGVPDVYGLPLGLLCIAAGLGWLVLRLWSTTPAPGHDGDDGAAV